MKTTSSAKKNILKKIKQALEKPVPVPFDTRKSNPDFFINNKNDLEFQFAENFSALQGRFSFCANEKELAEQLQTLFSVRQWKNIFLNEEKLQGLFINYGMQINEETNLAECDAAATSCEYLIARTGSIVLSSTQNGRTSSVYAPVHICVAYTDQLIFDVNDGLNLLKKKYVADFPSLITFASGPSRTADIEKTLVTGVHGPKEVFCFLVQSA